VRESRPVCSDERGGGEKMRYRVHRFNIRMTRDQGRLEQFLNSLEGKVVAIIPNVAAFPATYVDFVLIVEKVG
jgi:hypothetical protein